MSTVIHLPANQPRDRFYSGGARIRHFRGEGAPGNRVPEDWVASTTTLFGNASLGLSTLPDGRRLVDAITADPEFWLGLDHVGGFGVDTMLLVKLLDAGQRLPVHIHPDRSFAIQHLGRRHGKAEAWYILESGTVHLGFTRDIELDELREWVEAQDVSAMIGSMHVIEVAASDSVYVPPGTPHAIGNGVFLVEVQEPEDLSILLEWAGFEIDGAADGHLGLGFDTALTAIDLRGRSMESAKQLVRRQGLGDATLARGSEQYFRAERLEVDGTTRLEAGFSIVVVLDGAGVLSTNDAQFDLSAGDTAVVAHAAGDLRFSGSLSIVRCRPPATTAE